MPDNPTSSHSLPHPGPAVDAHHRPFVGNASVEDNLCETARVAVWNALGKAGGYITLRPSDGCIRVGGRVHSRSDRNAALEAVAAAIAPLHLIDELAVDLPVGAPNPELHYTPGTPIARVRRFCSLTDASLSAAVTDAVRSLDAALAAHGVARPAKMALVYRNRGPSTVTVDVGALIAPSTLPAGHGLEMDTLPGGPYASVPAQAGVHGLVAAQSELLGRAHETEHDAIWWQILDSEELHPWRGPPASTLYMVLHSLPG